jgi:hypothetical protein
VALPATVLARVGEPDAPAAGAAPEPEGAERGSVRAEPVGPEPVRAAPVVVGPPPPPVEEPGVDQPPAVPVGASAPSEQAATPRPDGDAIAWRSAPRPEDMPRRAPTTAAPEPGPEAGNGDRGGNGLTTRTPGTHLTHQPGATAAPSTGDVRPRPERVQDLLSRHDRGKRDGRVHAPDAPPAPQGDDV